MRALAVWCSLAWARGTDTVQTDTLELLDLKELEAMRARSEDGQVPLPGSEHPSPTPKATEARKNSNDKQHEATAKAPQRPALAGRLRVSRRRPRRRASRWKCVGVWRGGLVGLRCF